MDKRNIVNRFFPIKFDFNEMLDKQALIKYVKLADEVRMEMEKDLIQAFSTPFDREDIYSISVGMDKVIEYAKSTLLSMKAFDVKPNDSIINMTAKLKEGADIFSRCIKSLKNN